MMPSRFLRRDFAGWLAAFVALTVFHVPLRAAETDEPTIMLPPLEVVGAGPTGRPWEYAAYPGGEVLSRTSQGVTREFLEAQFRLQQVIALILPVELQGKRSVPDLLILTTQAEASNPAKDIVARAATEGAAKAKALSSQIVLDADFDRTRTSVRILPNLRLNDTDSTAVYATIDEFAFRGSSLQFMPDQLRFLLESRVPRLPRWFVAGLEDLFAEAQLKDNTLTFGRAGWVPREEALRILGSADYAPKLFDLTDLFEKTPPPARDASLEASRIWRAHAALFVRWMLMNDSRRARLWKLVARAADGPVTEEIFQQTTGLDYFELRERLGDHLRQAMMKGEFTLKVPKLARLPAVEIRPATPVEIARMRGDWERVVANWVRARQPTFLEQYVRQARRTLSQAYERGERDPRLLAVLGLFECDLGNDRAALPYLEAAHAAGVIRPRVYFELARIRYADALAKPEGEERLLNVAQLNTVMEPFKVGFAQEPALLESYRLMAEAWCRSAVILRPEQIALCDRAVRLFPTDLDLIYSVALLKTTHGFFADAVALARRGEALSDHSVAKAQFTKLINRLAFLDPPSATSR